MTTIAYDLPVKDLIAGLDATEHVTHAQYRKTHVTLHHNGGRLSHEGVLSVWQTREASAHFDCDAAGAVAQYVRVNEYAWATGSTVGNQRSISIEMCNETLGPQWRVGEATWRSAARLAGWLFLRVIGSRPTRDTLVPHKYWSSTDCPGPYTDQVYEQMLAIAQNYYDTGGNEDDMLRAVNMGTLPAGDSGRHTLTLPSWHDNAALGLCVGFEDVTIEAMWFISSGRYLAEVSPFTLKHDSRRWWTLPKETDQISILVAKANVPIGWSVELERA